MNSQPLPISQRTITHGLWMGTVTFSSLSRQSNFPLSVLYAPTNCSKFAPGARQKFPVRNRWEQSRSQTEPEVSSWAEANGPITSEPRDVGSSHDSLSASCKILTTITPEEREIIASGIRPMMVALARNSWTENVRFFETKRKLNQTRTIIYGPFYSRCHQNVSYDKMQPSTEYCGCQPSTEQLESSPEPTQVHTLVKQQRTPRAMVTWVCSKHPKQNHQEYPPQDTENDTQDQWAFNRTIPDKGVVCMYAHSLQHSYILCKDQFLWERSKGNSCWISHHAESECIPNRGCLAGKKRPDSRNWSTFSWKDETGVLFCIFMHTEVLKAIPGLSKKFGHGRDDTMPETSGLSNPIPRLDGFVREQDGGDRRGTFWFSLSQANVWTRPGCWESQLHFTTDVHGKLSQVHLLWNPGSKSPLPYFQTLDASLGPARTDMGHIPHGQEGHHHVGCQDFLCLTVVVQIRSCIPVRVINMHDGPWQKQQWGGRGTQIACTRT